jgi:hypothetical protein
MTFQQTSTTKERVMTVKDLIRHDLASAEFVGLGYLQDLTDDDLFRRPVPGANHINWQLGHLIFSEHHHVSSAAPGAMPPLPEGFAEQYAKDKAESDDRSQFRTKAELLEIYRQQRGATLAALDAIDDAALDRESGVPYAPTVAALFALHSGHWMMHSGQWVIVRRLLGKKAMF